MAAKPPETLAPVSPGVPRPRSPPKYPDICGRHRLQAEAQILNREILFLEEELQSLEEAQPVSRCCKEVDEFVQTKADPLILQKKKKRKSCSFIKSLRCSCGCVWYCCPSCKEQRFCCCDKACCVSQCLC